MKMQIKDVSSVPKNKISKPFSISQWFSDSLKTRGCLRWWDGPSSPAHAQISAPVSAFPPNFMIYVLFVVLFSFEELEKY